jgi:DDE superfamily endonuclease
VRRYCIPEKDRARFVAQMEEVLDVYARPPDPLEPLVCMDEAAKQLLGHAVEPLPMEPGAAGRPGRPAREDYHYTRGGVRSVFMFFAPLLGWRRVASSERRTRVEWAAQVKRLVDEDFPHARKIVLVCDNLNTHHVASLYEAFEPEEARRIARKLEIHYTPRNGSWLNVAEVELSVLSEQCLDRRIGDAEALDRELAAWQRRRNEDASKVKWQFTTADARVKLRRLYPTF